MSSFGVIAGGRDVKVGIMVMDHYPVMCANCCPFHENDEEYCELFKKKLIKIESHYARAADCLKSEAHDGRR
jgi:hypothetical protein